MSRTRRRWGFSRDEGDGDVTRGFHSCESRAVDETAAECAEGDGAKDEVAAGGRVVVDTRRGSG
jgi:hypothetical protein